MQPLGLTFKLRRTGVKYSPNISDMTSYSAGDCHTETSQHFALYIFITNVHLLPLAPEIRGGVPQWCRWCRYIFNGGSSYGLPTKPNDCGQLQSIITPLRRDDAKMMRNTGNQQNSANTIPRHSQIDEYVAPGQVILIQY